MLAFCRHIFKVSHLVRPPPPPPRAVHNGFGDTCVIVTCGEAICVSTVSCLRNISAKTTASRTTIDSLELIQVMRKSTNNMISAGQHSSQQRRTYPAILFYKRHKLPAILFRHNLPAILFRHELSEIDFLNSKK